jgi:hypothetical protein
MTGGSPNIRGVGSGGLYIFKMRYCLSNTVFLRISVPVSVFLGYTLLVGFDLKTKNF